MGLQTALLLTVMVSIASSYGLDLGWKMSSLREADGLKSMEVIKKQGSYLSNKNSKVTKGPPCDKEFSWTYVRPGTAMEIRSRWLGKAMNFPEICGWSFWTDADLRNRLVISCDYIDIRDTDYLMAYDYGREQKKGWQGISMKNFELDEHTKEIAFGLESNQVRDKRSFECTVSTVYTPCGSGTVLCADASCGKLDLACTESKRVGGNCLTSVNDEDCTSSLDFPENWYICLSGNGVTPDAPCNADINCEDDSDETDCPSTIDCNEYQIPCEGVCKSLSIVCDITEDCTTDGIDEVDCNNARVCPGDWISCSNGRCIYPSMVCDGTKDCSDESDEENCLY